MHRLARYIKLDYWNFLVQSNNRMDGLIPDSNEAKTIYLYVSMVILSGIKADLRSEYF